ncbi:MAG: modification methylase [Gammaproteobacteria bacterium AqS3]|nr:modification methylase [Gammaproteobacteria bacterium AqS3]
MKNITSKQMNLNAARIAKKDEFYTQLSDVENEMMHYRNHFKGKVIYCNCDDPRESAFFKYFFMKFHHLGLKRLIASCYRNTSRDLFSRHDSEKAIWLSYDGSKHGDQMPSIDDIGINEFNGDGDFRSSEAMDLLRQSDIVITNPPFSLFRPYISQLMECNKKFIVIGSLNAISYRDIWAFIRDGRLWLGCENRASLFRVPDDYEGSNIILKDGVKFAKMGNTYWYTNLNHKKRSVEMIMPQRYKGNEDAYPFYDNIKAIEVNKVKNIPCDYKGVMGVPITFLEHYNPDQFTILGLDMFDMPRLPHLKTKGSVKWDRGYIQGQRKYARILIQRK